MPLRTGKLPPEVLQSLVLSHLGRRRPEVLVHASLGEDCSVIDFGEWVGVLSTDPITGAVANAGWLAVHVSCNDVAACGAEPVGVLPTLLLPEGTTEADIRRTMAQINAAAQELGVEVLGGHTEVTPGLANSIISLTAVGKARRAEYVTSAGARPGDDIVMSKWAGLEGTAILATDLGDRLAGRVDEALLAEARQLIDRISVVKEGLAAARHGATALHDATEGGVLGALYEMAQASGVGLEVQPAVIPLLPSTREICRALGADPLRLIASGTMLMAAPPQAKLAQVLAREGVPASTIGRALPLEAGLWLVAADGRRSSLQPPERDELWRVLEMLA
ncbi:MAG: AIR synthase family protein [Chloroflexi bacterium]|nr:AIR synthase family protein [Chloroflexota bacterium]MCL5110642.1 AIR synthase family protein [Chloroflexota bacterium]